MAKRTQKRMGKSATAVATLAWAIREQERIREENERVAASIARFRALPEEEQRAYLLNVDTAGEN